MAVAKALLAADDDVLEASTPHLGNGAGRGARRARGAGEEALWSPSARERTRAAFAAAPQFVMLDFRSVARAGRVREPQREASSFFLVELARLQ